MTDEIRIQLGHGLELEEATFVERPNQFVLVLDQDGAEVRAAMADRGRLADVLLPGRTILIEPRSGKTRKTAFQALAAIDDKKRLVSLDTQLPNKLVARALAHHALDELGDYDSWRAEQTLGSSRFDFVLNASAGERVIVEVKSVGKLRDDDVAIFPDAPTSRGARHVRELTKLTKEPNTRCAVLFIIQSSNADSMTIDHAIDPDLLAALEDADDAGVEILTRSCSLTRQGLALGSPATFIWPRERERS